MNSNDIKVGQVTCGTGKVLISAGYAVGDREVVVDGLTFSTLFRTANVFAAEEGPTSNSWNIRVFVLCVTR